MKRARLISRSGKYTCIFPTFRKTRNTRRPCKAGSLFVCLKHTLKKKSRAFRNIGKIYFPGREISLALFWIIKNFLSCLISHYQRKCSKFFKIMKGGKTTTTITGQKNFITFCEMLESLNRQHDKTKRQTVSKTNGS